MTQAGAMLIGEIDARAMGTLITKLLRFAANEGPAFWALGITSPPLDHGCYRVIPPPCSILVTAFGRGAWKEEASAN